MSFDTFHSKADRIYRVAEIYTQSGNIQYVVIFLAVAIFLVAGFQSLKSATTDPVKAIRYE